MSDDYGYINARLRGMKSRLLTGDRYEEALSAGSFEEIIAFLDGTPYAPEVEKALALRKGIAGVDEGLRRDMEKTFARIAGIASDRPGELLHILMGRWELHNIKTILRGKQINATLESVMGSVIPFGRLDDVALRELASQQDVRSVINLLSQWGIPYASPLRKVYPQYREKEDLQIVEVALDRAYFEAALSQLDTKDPNDALVMELVRREIDVILIGYALRVVHHALGEPETERVFIPGGKDVSRGVFESLVAAKDIDDLIGKVETPCYHECLDSGMVKYLEYHRLSTLERALEVCYIKNACRSIHGDPLSISVLIAYLWLKINEIINLRIIARGKHTSMPREEIEKYLVLN